MFIEINIFYGFPDVLQMEDITWETALIQT